MFGTIFSLQLETRERNEDLNARFASRGMLQEIMKELSRADDYSSGLLGQADNLVTYIRAGGPALNGTPAGGLGILLNGRISTRGTTPKLSQISALVEFLVAKIDANGDGIFCADCLSEHYPPARGLACKAQ